MKYILYRVTYALEVYGERWFEIINLTLTTFHIYSKQNIIFGFDTSDINFIIFNIKPCIFGTSYKYV